MIAVCCLSVVSTNCCFPSSRSHVFWKQVKLCRLHIIKARTNFFFFPQPLMILLDLHLTRSFPEIWLVTCQLVQILWRSVLSFFYILVYNFLTIDPNIQSWEEESTLVFSFVIWQGLNNSWVVPTNFYKQTTSVDNKKCTTDFNM